MNDGIYVARAKSLSLRYDYDHNALVIVGEIQTDSGTFGGLGYDLSKDKIIQIHKFFGMEDLNNIRNAVFQISVIEDIIHELLPLFDSDGKGVNFRKETQ